jgi:hypothetical protein
MSYTIHSDGTITRHADGFRFSADDRLDEFREYAAWLAKGNAPDVDSTPAPLPRLVTCAEFRARFTTAEMAAILQFAYSGAGDVTAAMLLLKLKTSTEIDLDSPEVESGLAYLTAKGCIAAGRAAEILATSAVSSINQG